MGRAILRGKKLEKKCNKAKTTTNECGPDDNRVFCFGFNDASTEELIQECRKCKANVIYAESEGEG